MRPWLTAFWLFTLVLPFPVAAQGMADYWADGDGCDSSSGVDGQFPHFDDTGNLRMIVLTKAQGVAARICIVDADGQVVESGRAGWNGPDKAQVSWDVRPASFEARIALQGGPAMTGAPYYGRTQVDEVTLLPAFDLAECASGQGTLLITTINDFPQDLQASWSFACDTTPGRGNAAGAVSPDLTVEDGTQQDAVRAGAWGLALGTLLWVPPLRRAAFLLFSRVSTAGTLDHPHRRSLLDAVTSSPGIHGRALRQALELGQGQFQYHMDLLVRRGLVEGLSIGRSRHFFVAGRYTEVQKRSLAVLRRHEIAQLYEMLRKGRPGTMAQVAEVIGCSKSSVSKMLRHLELAGLVSRTRGARLDDVTVRAPLR